MVGLGGLEPPTSPLSGARSSHLSYRPFKTAWRTAHNLFSLRCLSVVRNCVQIRALCTRQQFLYRFSLLSVVKVRVVAGDSHNQNNQSDSSRNHRASYSPACGGVYHVWRRESHWALGLMPSFSQSVVRYPA